jgi:hypothetical protein
MLYKSANSNANYQAGGNCSCRRQATTPAPRLLAIAGTLSQRFMSRSLTIGSMAMTDQAPRMRDDFRNNTNERHA